MGSIKVKGYVEKEVAADIVEYTISFIGKDIKASVSLNEARKQSEVFLKELKDTGFDIRQIHLSDDSLEEDRYHDERNGKEAVRRISFKTRFDPKFSNLILRIVEHNDLNVSIRTSYDIADKTALHEQMIKEAVNESRKRAELIASANGQKVRYIDSAQDERYEEEKMEVLGIKLPDDYLADSETFVSDELQGKMISQSVTVYITWFIE